MRFLTAKICIGTRLSARICIAERWKPNIFTLPLKSAVAKGTPPAARAPAIRGDFQAFFKQKPPAIPNGYLAALILRKGRPHSRFRRDGSAKHLFVSSARHPRPGHVVLALKAVNILLVRHGQAYVIKAIYQAVLFKRVNIKPDDLAVRPRNGLILQVHRQSRVRAKLRVVHQFINDVLRQLNQQHAVLGRIVEENVREISADQALHTEI